MLQYKRILLKLSGEALAGEDGYGIDPLMLERYADEIREAQDMGAEIALVIGGGNIFRGMSEAAANMDRVQADYMGMLATVINALALQDALERKGVFTRLQTAIKMEHFAITKLSWNQHLTQFITWSQTIQTRHQFQLRQPQRTLTHRLTSQHCARLLQLKLQHHPVSQYIQSCFHN